MECQAATCKQSLPVAPAIPRQAGGVGPHAAVLALHHFCAAELQAEPQSRMGSLLSNASASATAVKVLAEPDSLISTPAQKPDCKDPPFPALDSPSPSSYDTPHTQSTSCCSRFSRRCHSSSSSSASRSSASAISASMSSTSEASSAKSADRWRGLRRGRRCRARAPAARPLAVARSGASAGGADSGASAGAAAALLAPPPLVVRRRTGGPGAACLYRRSS